MTWARVVEDEIVQIFEEDPSQYFHPDTLNEWVDIPNCLLYTSPSPRDRQKSRMPSSA